MIRKVNSTIYVLAIQSAVVLTKYENQAMRCPHSNEGGDSLEIEKQNFKVFYVFEEKLHTSIIHIECLPQRLKYTSAVFFGISSNF